MAPSRERVPVVIVEYDEIAKTIARRIAEIIKERRKEGGHAVLGLATGSTPIGIYRELIKMHREEGLDFSDVVTFNLDEYYPMKPESTRRRSSRVRSKASPTQMSLPPICSSIRTPSSTSTTRRQQISPVSARRGSSAK